MPRKPIKFDLDFMVKNIFSRFSVKQFDDITFTITPLINDQPYDTSNMTCRLFVGVNNDMFMQDKNITVSNNSIVVKLDKNMLSKDGRAYAEIELTDSQGTMTSASFLFDIDRKIGEGATTPGDVEGFLAKYEKLIIEFKKLQGSTTEMDTNFKNRFTANESRLDQIEVKNTEQDNRFQANELRLSQIEKKNTEQDDRLNSVERISKRQDVALSGLLNESGDKRLAITGEGNHLKLEHSKDGVVEVNSVVGNTLVNLQPSAIPRFQIGLGGDSLDAYTVQTDNNYIKITGNGINPPAYRYINMGRIAFEMYKPSTTYTLTFSKLKGIKSIMLQNGAATSTMLTANIKPTEGVLTYTMTTRDSFISDSQILYLLVDNTLTDLDVEVKNPVILEGDYTSKPIPNEYFEGMKSTFEDCLVTQEMIDAGTEKAENLNKYKAELKVVGKNKIDFKNMKVLEGYNTICEPRGNGLRVTFNSGIPTTTTSYTFIRSGYYTIDPKVKCFIFKFKFTSSKTQRPRLLIKFTDSNVDKSVPALVTYSSNGEDLKMSVPQGAKYIQFIVYSCDGEEGIIKGDYIDYYDVQLEEVEDIGSSSTDYEPYKEHVQTLYLDEPLYKDNELCIHNGQLGYWKNCERVILDGTQDVKFHDWRNTDSSKGQVYRKSVANTPIDSYTHKINTMSDTIASVKYNDLYDYVFNEGVSIANGVDYSLAIKISTSKLINLTIDEYLAINPVTVEYPLAEPIFVPILDETPKWVLECFDECTLSIDSNIPATSMSAVYTGNVVSVVALEKVQYQQDAVNLDNAYRLTILEITSGGVV